MSLTCTLRTTHCSGYKSRTCRRRGWRKVMWNRPPSSLLQKLFPSCMDSGKDSKKTIVGSSPSSGLLSGEALHIWEVVQRWRLPLPGHLKLMSWRLVIVRFIFLLLLDTVVLGGCWYSTPVQTFYCSRLCRKHWTTVLYFFYHVASSWTPILIRFLLHPLE